MPMLQQVQLRSRGADRVALCRERGIPGFDEMQRFSACDIWPLIKGKTLWIVGDSHSFDLARAAACFFLPVSHPGKAS